MKISIQGKRLVLTDPIKNYAESKLSKVEKYNDSIIELVVTLSAVKLKTGNSHTAEVLAYLSGATLKAKATEEDLYVAIDQVYDIILGQLKKHKDKQKRASIHYSERKNIKNDTEPNTISTEDEKNIVRVFLPNKPMEIEDAILQLEALEKMFYAFVNSDTGNMCVLYKRKDGDYGLIEQ